VREIELDNTLSQEGLRLTAKAINGRRGDRLRIALLASEDCKKALAQFALRHADFLSRQTILATSGTCRAVRALTELSVESVGHGPEGGDIVLANEVLSRRVDLVVFLRSGMEVAPHEDDIRMLLRSTNLTNCPLATNVATAELVLGALESTAAEEVSGSAGPRERLAACPH
jgi:methylglyoxal synthase